MTTSDTSQLLSRDQILEEFPEIVQEAFLDPELDYALLGAAAQSSKPPVPLYGWVRARSIKRKTSWEVAKECQPLLAFSAPGPCVLLPVEHTSFWQRARDKEIVVWDRLNSAIIGLGYYGAGKGYSVVYDFDKTILTLAKECKDGTTDRKEQILNALDYFNTKIKPANWGDQTPTFAHIIICEDIS